MRVVSFQFATEAGFTAVFLVGSFAYGAGGTSIIARKGETVPTRQSWPKGVEALVNDPVRTTGWNSWFTEWPSDVGQYALEVQTTKDVNRLIEKLAAVEHPLKQIRLCALKEPRGLGWTTRLPEGNGIGVIFSLGDQARVDQWYKNLRQPFGVMEFTDTPVAVPPTLTLFVQHDALDLDKLDVPAGVAVSAGYVPTVFHQWNLKREKGAPNPPPKEILESQVQKASDAIHAFLKRRK